MGTHVIRELPPAGDRRPGRARGEEGGARDLLRRSRKPWAGRVLAVCVCVCVCVVYRRVSGWRAWRGSGADRSGSRTNLSCRLTLSFPSFFRKWVLSTFCSRRQLAGEGQGSLEGHLSLRGMEILVPFAHWCHILPPGQATDRCTLPRAPFRVPSLPFVSHPDIQQTWPSAGAEYD